MDKQINQLLKRIDILRGLERSDLLTAACKELVALIGERDLEELGLTAVPKDELTVDPAIIVKLARKTVAGIPRDGQPVRRWIKLTSDEPNDGISQCYYYPQHKASYWRRRDGILICGICHPPVNARTEA